MEELQLETSDGIRIAAWYYPAAEGSKADATVILVHDLDGSHETVDTLARSLQVAGCAVVAPDLRGHGESGLRPDGVRGDAGDSRLLKKADLESIAAATGGSHRGQAALRGEIEAVRNWIKQKSETGELDIDRLCVVGCGLAANHERAAGPAGAGAGAHQPRLGIEGNLDVFAPEERCDPAQSPHHGACGEE